MNCCSHKEKMKYVYVDVLQDPRCDTRNNRKTFSAENSGLVPVSSSASFNRAVRGLTRSIFHTSWRADNPVPFFNIRSRGSGAALGMTGRGALRRPCFVCNLAAAAAQPPADSGLIPFFSGPRDRAGGA